MFVGLLDFEVLIIHLQFFLFKSEFSSCYFMLQVIYKIWKVFKLFFICLTLFEQLLIIVEFEGLDFFTKELDLFFLADDLFNNFVRLLLYYVYCILHWQLFLFHHQYSLFVFTNRFLQLFQRCREVVNFIISTICFKLKPFDCFPQLDIFLR